MRRFLFFTVAVLGLTFCWAAPADPAGDKKNAGKGPSAASTALPTPRSLVAALVAPVTFERMDDPKTTLSELLEFLTHRYHVPFTIKHRAFRMENPEVPDVGKAEVVAMSPIPAMKAPLGKVIARILARLDAFPGATFLVRGDGIEITTATAVAAEISIERRQSGNTPGAGARARKKASPAKPPANLPQPGKPGLGGGVPPAGNLPPGLGGGPPGLGGLGGGFGQMGIVNLDDKRFNVAVVSVAIQSQSLEEALRQIRSQANISLVLDPALGDKAQTALTVTLLNAPVDSALQVLTEMAGLDFVWLDNIFYVTARDKAKELRNSWPDRRSGGTEDFGRRVE